MASAAALVGISPKPEPEWDEAKILSSLARLQEMHVQVGYLISPGAPD